MAFSIRMGLPEMETLWHDLATRKQQGKLDKDEEKFFKKLIKALGYLADKSALWRCEKYEKNAC